MRACRHVHAHVNDGVTSVVAEFFGELNVLFVTSSNNCIVVTGEAQLLRYESAAVKDAVSFFDENRCSISVKYL